MRISDWSSDVCSSDLTASLKGRFFASTSAHSSRAVTSAGVLRPRSMNEKGLTLDHGQDRRLPVSSQERGSCQSDNSPSTIGSASCRARVCQYVSISVGAVTLKKKTQSHTNTQP